jgi:hypothetical protein
VAGERVEIGQTERRRINHKGTKDTKKAEKKSEELF